MKILYVQLYDARFKMGGAEQVMWDLLLGMRRQEGHHVACAVNPGDLSDKIRHEGIRVDDLAWSKSGTFQTLSGLRKAIRWFHRQ